MTVNLFFVPHQDDEMLTMGVAIARSVAEGHETHVVLCTDGGLDGTRFELASGGPCNLDSADGGRYAFHEGDHRYQMDVPEFAEARDLEYLRSCRALGVPACHAHIHPARAVDGELSVAQAKRMICDFLAIFPSAVVCTEADSHSNVYDPNLPDGGVDPADGYCYHIDHLALGVAAHELLTAGAVDEVRLYADPYHVERFRRDEPENVYEEVVPTEPELEAVRRSIALYRTWDPESGRYAIGYHSAHELFPSETGDFNNYVRVLRR